MCKKINTSNEKKINKIGKPLAKLCTKNKLPEKQIKKTIPFTIALKNNTILRNKFKEVKDLYTENYKTLMKKIEDTNNWNDILCSWIRRINIVRMSILPKTIYKVKILMSLFYKNRKKS